MSDQSAPNANASAEPVKLSGAEAAKIESNYLRGTIAEEPVDGTLGFSKSSEVLLKHHGTYIQDDRDARKVSKDRIPMMMVRTRIPGGRLTPGQRSRRSALGMNWATARFDSRTRQAIQHHGVPKSELRELTAAFTT
ncbi:MAG: hypothetical protein R3B96_17970 [Pirellulaceae bacterium]